MAKPPITDCHECYLAQRATPAIWATAAGDFYCDPCRKAEGLEVADVMTIRQWMEANGYAQPTAAIAPAVAEQFHQVEEPEIEEQEQSVSVQEETMSKNGNCGCGRPAEHRGRCAFRRANGGPTARAGKRAVRTLAPPSKPSAILPPAAAGAENAAIGTLVVSEAQMVRMFSGLPVEAKVAALQAYLDGQQ